MQRHLGAGLAWNRAVFAQGRQNSHHSHECPTPQRRGSLWNRVRAQTACSTSFSIPMAIPTRAARAAALAARQHGSGLAQTGEQALPIALPRLERIAEGREPPVQAVFGRPIWGDGRRAGQPTRPRRVPDPPDRPNLAGNHKACGSCGRSPPRLRRRQHRTAVRWTLTGSCL